MRPSSCEVLDDVRDEQQAALTVVEERVEGEHKGERGGMTRLTEVLSRATSAILIRTCPSVRP